VLVAEGRQKDNWQHTSSVLCMLANINRDPKQKRSAYKPSDFNPFDIESRKKAPTMKITLRQAFNLLKEAAK
jgi:hypothetical protein